MTRRLVHASILLVVLLGSCTSERSDARHETSALESVTTAPEPSATPAPASLPTPMVPEAVEPAPAPEPTITELDPQAALCDVLRRDGYETRKAAIVDSPGEELAAAREHCGEDLDRVQQAMAIEVRRDAARATEPSLSFDDIECDESGFSAVVTNHTAEPIGALLNFRYVFASSDRMIATADEPLVLWRLEPGQSVPVSGTSSYVPQIEVRCGLAGTFFLADDSSHDASLAAPSDPAIAVDDPTVWFPALIESESSATGSGDPDLAAMIEDVRSTAYDSVVESTDPGRRDDRVATATVCPGTVTQPSPDLMSFVFLLEWSAGTVVDEGTAHQPAETLLASGVFRRGADGQWRWLGTAQLYDSSVLWERCGRPT